VIYLFVMLMLNCEVFQKCDCFDFSTLTFKYSDSHERMFPSCWKMDASIPMRLKRGIFHASVSVNRQNSIFHFFFVFSFFHFFIFSSVCGVFPPAPVNREPGSIPAGWRQNFATVRSVKSECCCCTPTKNVVFNQTLHC
jgi:hypothetical protein